MSMSLAFWIVMLLWAIFGIVPLWRTSPVNYGLAGGGLLLFILIALLGWHDFGAPIHG